MAGKGIKKRYHAFILEPENNESLAKGMVNQSRREGNFIYPGCWKLGNEMASSCVPDSDVGIFVKPTCKEFPVG